MHESCIPENKQRQTGRYLQSTTRPEKRITRVRGVGQKRPTPISIQSKHEDVGQRSSGD